MTLVEMCYYPVTLPDGSRGSLAVRAGSRLAIGLNALIAEMTMPTTQKTFDKDAALAALAERREANRTRKRVRNDTLHAGSAMHFDCKGCGADIAVPEDYITKPDYCGNCCTLQDNGGTLLQLPPMNERFWYRNGY